MEEDAPDVKPNTNFHFPGDEAKPHCSSDSNGTSDTAPGINGTADPSSSYLLAGVKQEKMDVEDVPHSSYTGNGDLVAPTNGSGEVFKVEPVDLSTRTLPRSEQTEACLPKSIFGHKSLQPSSQPLYVDTILLKRQLKEYRKKTVALYPRHLGRPVEINDSHSKGDSGSLDGQLGEASLVPTVDAVDRLGGASPAPTIESAERLGDAGSAQTVDAVEHLGDTSSVSTANSEESVQDTSLVPTDEAAERFVSELLKGAPGTSSIETASSSPRNDDGAAADNPVSNSEESLSDFEKRMIETVLQEGFAQERKEKKMWPCDFCGKEFSSASYVNKHRTMHTGEKLYECEYCCKKFPTSSDLKIHKRMHTGERPFTCDICGKKFARSGHLTIHVRTHTGEKPYKCDLCGICFSKSSHLRSHHKTHTGEKPFTCEDCGKKFSERTHLKIHRRTHTGEKPYVCEFCTKAFSDSSTLNRHKRIHTREQEPVKPS